MSDEARAASGASRWRADLILVLALTGVAMAVLRALTSAIGAQELVFGSDTALWGLTARNLQIGLPSMLPPVYPWLVSLLEGQAGTLVNAALLVSGWSWMLLMPAMFLLSRALGASIEAALVGALAVLGLPELLFFGMQLQPDGMAALVLLGGGPVAAWYWRSPTLPRSLGLCLWGLFTWLVREHGSVLLAVYAALLLAAPGSRGQRALRLVMLGLLMILAPVVALSQPALPWDAPWMQRIFLATSGTENIPTPMDAPPDIAARVLAHKEAHELGDRFAILRIHALNNLGESRDEWMWIGLGLLALPFAPARRRWLVLPVLTALATLPILAQRRHVLVAVPCAILVVASLLDPPDEGWPRHLLARLARGVVLVGALALAGHSAMQAWGGIGPIYRQRAALAEQERSFAMTLCSQARRGDLLDVSGGPRGFMVYCTLPASHVEPGRTEPADWRTWHVGPFAPGTDWQAMGPSITYSMDGITLHLYRLAPWYDEDRPCQDSLPRSNTPYLTLSPRPADMEPGCSW